jgi:hypothetical protein
VEEMHVFPGNRTVSSYQTPPIQFGVDEERRNFLGTMAKGAAVAAAGAQFVPEVREAEAAWASEKGKEFVQKIIENHPLIRTMAKAINLIITVVNSLVEVANKVINVVNILMDGKIPVVDKSLREVFGLTPIKKFEVHHELIPIDPERVTKTSK